MMDRDFPTTSRERKWTAVALGVCAVVGVLLFGGFVPGLHPSYGSPPTVTLDGRAYYWTMVLLPFPPPGSERTAPTSLLFHNVTFETWFTNWTVLGGAYLHGRVHEPNGTVDAFVIGGFPAQANWTEQYLAPDRAVAVQWHDGLTADFLVLA